jgi:hypothetical protein
MSRSFFTGNDAKLFQGSAAFAAKMSADPEAVGLSESDAAAYAVLDADYAAAYRAAANKTTRTQGDIMRKDGARAALRQMASGLARTIAGVATVTDQQRINLGLSVRKDPSPMPPPGTPSECRVTLVGNGAIELAWKCGQPRGSTGTMYHVHRRSGADPAFAYLGTTGTKRFVDATLPADSGRLVYQIRAVRSTKAGVAAEFNVNFGMTAGGAAAAGMTPKIAA